MEIKYEMTGGSFVTPKEKEGLNIPPAKSGRKDIEVGELVISTAPNSAKEQARVDEAKRYNITEIPTEKLTVRDMGR